MSTCCKKIHLLNKNTDDTIFLLSQDADRNSGAWLGNDEDPLVGFNWSTSYERNTIGIHIWSRLFPMTLNGEKVQPKQFPSPR